MQYIKGMKFINYKIKNFSRKVKMKYFKTHKTVLTVNFS